MMGGSGENKQKNGQKNAEFKKVNQKKVKDGEMSNNSNTNPPQAPSTRGGYPIPKNNEEVFLGS